MITGVLLSLLIGLEAQKHSHNLWETHNRQQDPTIANFTGSLAVVCPWHRYACGIRQEAWKLVSSPYADCFAPVMQVKRENPHEWRCASSNPANAVFHKCSRPSAAELITKCRAVHHRCPVGSIIWTMPIPGVICISTGIRISLCLRTWIIQFYPSYLCSIEGCILLSCFKSLSQEVIVTAGWCWRRLTSYLVPFWSPGSLRLPNIKCSAPGCFFIGCLRIFCLDKVLQHRKTIC